MITSGQASEVYSILNSEKAKGGLKGTVRLLIHDENGNTVGVQELYSGTDVNDEMLNQSLLTAKKIFSRLAGGDMSYKIARIAFGNAGHNFDNQKQAIDALETDVELNAAHLIKNSLNEDSDKHFLYTHTNQDNSTSTYRLVYIEKEILPAHITYGQDGNQFVVRVPISYDDFNRRVGGAETTDVNYEQDLVQYKLINDSDGTVMEFDGVDSNGDLIGAYTEVHSWDDNGTRRYIFKNGVDSSGNVDTTNGGDRPQEISEILLCADITGSGTAESPYEKLSTSRMTSGLLSFPQGFTFTYEWTLSWNFV